MKPIRVAVITISDGVARGERTDTSGRAVVEWVATRSHELVTHTLIPDETVSIVAALSKLADAGEADVILTTGGTGLTRRDVTPEATLAVIERAAPGIAEAIRAQGAPHTPFAWLSRAVAGTRGATLIVNLPGSEAGVRDGLAVLDRLLAHAVQLLRGIDTTRH